MTITTHSVNTPRPGFAEAIQAMLNDLTDTRGELLDKKYNYQHSQPKGFYPADPTPYDKDIADLDEQETVLATIYHHIPLRGVLDMSKAQG